MYQFVAGSIFSATAFLAYTNLSLRFIFKHPSTVSTGTIFRIPCVSSDDADFEIRYGTNTIQMQTTADRHEDPAVFSIPVTANAWDEILITMNPNTLNLPVAYRFGAPLTVTTIDSGTVAGAMAATNWYLGEGTSNLGYVGGFGAWNGILSAANAEKFKARRHDMPLWVSPSTLIEYLRMDDFPVNEFTAASTNVSPDADVVNTFSSGTYANLISDDGTYLVANKSDDAETYTCTFGTFPIPTGYSAFSFTRTLRGWTDDTAQATQYLTLGSGTNLTSSTTSFTASEADSVSIVYSAASQSDIDGLKGSLVTPTMGKNDELSFEKDIVKVGYRKHATLSRSGIEWRSLPSCVLSVGYAMPGGGY